MSIKTFELSSVDGRRFVKVTDRWMNLRVDHNSTVTLISELGDRQASVDFRFTANYHASEAVVGLIQIEGNILWEGDAKGLVKGWSAGGQMPPDVAQEIHTVIMTNCIPEAVLLARELRLPPPIPIPQVKARERSLPRDCLIFRIRPWLQGTVDSCPTRYMRSRQIPIEVPRRHPTNAKDARIPSAPLTTNTTGQIRPKRVEPCRELRRSNATAQIPAGTRTSETKSATAVGPRDTSSHGSVCRSNLRGDMVS